MSKKAHIYNVTLCGKDRDGKTRSCTDAELLTDFSVGVPLLSEVFSLLFNVLVNGWHQCNIQSFQFCMFLKVVLT